MENPRPSLPPQWEKLFPRDLFGRIALGLVSLLFTPISGAFVWVSLFSIGGGNADWWSRLLITEIALAFFVWSVVGLIWAIATPRWLESALPRVALRLMIAIFVGFGAFGITAVWAIFRV
jgi:hypothetical protein